MYKKTNKRILQLTLFMTFAAVLITACRKAFSERDENKVVSKSFDAVSLKDWYYGSFKKTSEWKKYNSTVRGLKLPDWEHGKYRKIGNLEFIEYPLIQEKKRVGINSSSSLTKDMFEQIGNATVSTVIFIKKQNEIIVRELQYIPDYNYLKSKGFDISNQTFSNPNNNFTGRVLAASWMGAIYKRNIFVNGNVTGRTKLLKNAMILDDNCGTMQFCIWQKDCTMTISADAASTVCGDWYNTNECWPESIPCNDPSVCAGMDAESCACLTLGVCGLPDDGDLCAIESSVSLDDALASISTSSAAVSTSLFSSTTVSRTKKYVWTALTAGSMGSTFTVNSHETGVHTYSDAAQSWIWSSLSHDDITVTTNFSAGVTFTAEYVNNSAEATVQTFTAQMRLKIKAAVSLVCKGSPITRSGYFTSTSPTWSTL